METFAALIQQRCISWNLHLTLQRIIENPANKLDKAQITDAKKVLAESQAAYDANPWGN